MKQIKINEALIAVYEYSNQGDAVLLLHPGGIFASYIWGNLASELKENYRVIAMDIRDHGNSECTPSGYEFIFN